MIARNRLSSEKTALVRVRLHQSPAAIAKAMQALDEMDENLHKAETFEDVQNIQRAAAVLKGLFRDYKKVADRAGEVDINARAIIGQKLAEQPRAKGTQLAGRTIGGNAKLLPKDDAPSYKQMGLTTVSSALQPSPKPTVRPLLPLSRLIRTGT
jgi:hypothetical protein